MRTVMIGDPFNGTAALSFAIDHGAVATSGIGRRLWSADSGFAHHLIDPGRGVPAWTGLVQATALAPSALEAETLAKAALLSGPEGAEGWLSARGGLVFDDAGRWTAFGPLAERIEAQDEPRRAA
jgi:thiamine biosynthesis lipoprotein